ncbi:MAG: class I SAM-dependent methyltransferase [Planctomycetes bacterium]|nr:class I SAM-dependent methyltransferase [Planctomycetota bacterium]
MLRRFCLPVLIVVVVVVAASCRSTAQDDDNSPDVVYVPTPNDVVSKMLEMAGVTKDDVVYDLGCGDGRILVTAAKKFGCKGVGYEIHPGRYQLALENVKKNNVGHLVEIRKENIFDADLSTATVVTLYLLPELNTRLIPQFEKMAPGSRIVSHEYGMEGVAPDETVTMTSKEDADRHHIYLWTIPLKEAE